MALLRVGGINPGKRREELLSNYDGEEPYMPGGYETPYNGEEPYMPDGYDEPYDDEPYDDGPYDAPYDDGPYDDYGDGYDDGHRDGDCDEDTGEKRLDAPPLATRRQHGAFPHHGHRKRAAGEGEEDTTTETPISETPVGTLSSLLTGSSAPPAPAAEAAATEAPSPAPNAADEQQALDDSIHEQMGFEF